MNGNSGDRTGEQATEQSPATSDPTRRRFLKGTATAGVAVAGVTAGTSGVTAQWFGGGSDGVPTFDIGSDGAGKLPESDASELVIYLHGGGVGSSAGSQGQDIQDGLADAGVEKTVVAGVFQETEAGFGEATSVPGTHLAGLIEDYMDSGGSVYIVGWSMGGMITMQTLNALGSGYVVEAGATFGTGTPNDDVCEGGTYHDGIANNSERFCVITSDTDSAVNAVNGTETRCGGENGAAPATLEQVDVTSDVDNHLGYLDSTLFYEKLADCYESGGSGTAGSGSGASGTAGEGGGGWWGSGSSGSDPSGTSGSSDSDSVGGWW